SEAHALTVRDTPLGERTTIPRSEWQFARVDDGSGNVVPDPTCVYLASGFTPKKIYEVVYAARNPPLAGLGLAAIRDAVARLKNEGAPELRVGADSYDRALAFGISQSGRVLRTFLYEGFNADERNRRVFDGVLAHIAGGARGGFNTRFAQPSRSSSSYLYANEVFPFTDAVQTDVESGRRDGLLARLGRADAHHARRSTRLCSARHDAHLFLRRHAARAGRLSAARRRRPPRGKSERVLVVLALVGAEARRL